MSEKFWNETLSQLDEKFTDEAAEHILADKSAAKSDGGVHAEPLELRGKKRSHIGLIAGIAAAAAAAAAVGITTAVSLNRDSGELVQSSSGASSAVDLSKPETASYSPETDDGGFSENVLNAGNYSMDIAIFNNCFSYDWQETENSGNTYALSLQKDDFFNLFGRRMAGLMQDDKGWYILCEYYGDSGSDGELLFIPRGEPNTMYHYSDVKTAVVNQPDRKYEAQNKLIGVSLDYPSKLGTAGVQFFCDKYGISAERFDSVTAEFDGQTYTAGGGMPYSGGATVTYLFDETVKFTKFLYPEENPAPEKAVPFEITLAKTGGEWVFKGAERVVLNENNALPGDDKLQHGEFDFNVLENSFFGVWYNEVFDRSVKFSYSEDNFNHIGFYPSCVFEDESGSYLSGINGGMGFAYFIPKNNPDIMYYYFDLCGDERLIDDYDLIFRRTAAGVVWSNYPTKLSVLGMRYLESGRAGEAVHLDLPDTVTDSGGNQWVYQQPTLGDAKVYSPFYLIDRNGDNRTSNFLFAAKYYLQSELDESGWHTDETSARYFTLEFDYTTKEFIRSYDWGDSIQDFALETDFSKRVIENAKADFSDGFYYDRWQTMTAVDSWYKIGADGSCFALRDLREAGASHGAYTELFYNANDGEGFKLVYSTNDIVTLKYYLEEYGYAFLYSSDFNGGAYITRVSSRGEAETAYIPKEQFGEMHWKEPYLLCADNNNIKFALDLLTMQPAEDYPEESDVTGSADVPAESEWLFFNGVKWVSANTPDLQWIYELGITEEDLGEIMGEVSVRVPKASDGFEDGSATALQAGTALYSVKTRGDIIAVYNEHNELEFYYKWVEG